MNLKEQKRALAAAVEAAHSAGAIMSRHLMAPKRIHVATQHDIKLELDVRCQKRIERLLRQAFPAVSILGEEGVLGNPDSDCRWVVDPIDGTVNFTYGIPHACVSIALQKRRAVPALQRNAHPDLDYETLVGVVHDPFCGETFTAIRGGKALLNGRPIRVSDRGRLGEAIVSIGFAKTRRSLDRMLPTLLRLTHRVRKIRIMGAAALSLAYVAAGRMDAYLEGGLRLWDIAAGGLILECAGGDFHFWPIEGQEHAFGLLANNGLLRKKLLKTT